MATLKYNAKKLQLLIPNAKRHTVTKFKRDNSEIRPSNIDVVVEAIYKDMEAINSSLGAATTLTALTDTPSNYTGDSNRIAGVVAGETGIEYKNWSIAASNLYPGSAGGTIGKAGNGVGKLYFDSSGELDYQGDLNILTAGTQKAVFKQTTGYLGLGVTNPLESIHSTGAIVIGNATQSSAGTLRYTAGDYQGHDGANWVSLIGGSNTAGNGLTKVGSQMELGGTLTADSIIIDSRPTTKGVEYGADYSADYTNRSLVDKGFVTSQITSQAYDDTAIQAAVTLNTAKISYNATDSAKLGLIESLADVTDTANVVAALSAGTGISISPSGVVDVTAVALTTVNTAANEVAQLALSSEEGDVVVRSDQNKSYVHNGGSSGTMSDYTLLATPTNAVLSVDGNTGAITASQIATAVESASNSNTFNDLDHSKLNAIESNADVTDTANVVAALSAGQGVSISAGGSIAVTSLAITEVNTVANEAAQLALTAEEGDVAVRSDENKSYIHNGGSAGTMADYTLLATPTNAVLSVAGNTGVVTSAQIKTAYEGELNAFTDAQFTKLATIETNAKDDQTGTEIKTAYEAVADTNAYDDAAVSKLASIESSATADQTGAEIKALYEVQANAYTDTKDTKLGTIETSADVTDTANVVASLSAGSGITISAGGVVAVSSLALVTVQTAASEAAQLAFTSEEGDVVIRSDLNKSYIHNGGVAGTMADYSELLTPTDAVLSVDGNTGAITSAQIKTAYEGEASAFTDAQFTKLAGIQAGATADDLSGYLLNTTDTLVGTLTVTGSGATSATKALLVENSAGTDILTVRDDGNVGIGANAATPPVKLTVDGAIGFSYTTLGSSANGIKRNGLYTEYYNTIASSGTLIAHQFTVTGSVPALTILQGKNIGINQAAPTARLHVKGAGTTNATTALLVEDSAGTDSFKVLDDGRVGIGGITPVAELDVHGSINLRSGYNLTWGGAYGAGIPALIGQASDGISIYSGGSTTGKTAKFTTTGEFGFGIISSITAKVHVRGSGTTSGTTALLVENSAGTDALEVKDDGSIHVDGVAGFTGTGAYTNFTIKNGIITAAS